MIHGITLGTIGNHEVVQGTGAHEGRVVLRIWDGLPNLETSKIVQETELSAPQAVAYHALLGMALVPVRRP